MKKELTGWELKDTIQLMTENIVVIEDYVKNYPLAALSDHKEKLLIIRKYQASLNCSPDQESLQNKSYMMGLAHYTNSSATYFRLPRNLKYTSIKIEINEQQEETIIIETSTTVIRTNVYELNKKLWIVGKLTESEVENTFLNLKNERNTTVVKPITQTSITSLVLGKMQQDKTFDDNWESKPQKLPWFNNQYIAIVYSEFNPNEDFTFLKEADKTVENILALTIQDRLLASEYVYQNCMDFLAMIGYDEADQPMLDIKDPNEIWRFVNLNDIQITRGDSKVYALFYFGCDWEEEHGLQLVFNDKAKLIRVSAIDCNPIGWEGDGMITE